MFPPRFRPYRPPFILPMRRPPSQPSVLYIRGRSRSPSVISISSSTGPLEDRSVRRRIRASTRSKWYGVLASFVLIACILMVLIFVSRWSSWVQGQPKEFPPQRLVGPFGRAETAAPLDRLTDDAGESIVRARAAVEPAPTTMATDRTERYTGEYFAPAVIAEEGTSAVCKTSACLSLRQWFVETVMSQADPCRKKNRFTCEASLSLPNFQRLTEEVSTEAGSLSSTEEVEPIAGPSATKAQNKMRRTESRNELFQSCVQYAVVSEEGVDDVLLLLSNFNLELLNMTEDSAEHPLARMMQLSLDYGIEVPVSFARKYNVSGEGAHAFELRIDVSREINDFFHALIGLGEADVMAFYEHVLSQYALLDNTSIAEELVNADDEVADITNRPANPYDTRSLDVTSLSEHTGVEAGLWKQLLNTYHTRTKTKELGNVTADERALALVAYMSRPGDRLGMRRLLAWHVLVYLLGPKVDLLRKLSGMQARQNTLDDEALKVLLKRKCERMMAKLDGIRYGALNIFEGDHSVSTETVANVGRFMAQFQSAMAFAFKGSKQDAKFASRAALTRLSSNSARIEDFALFPVGMSQSGTLSELFAAFGDVDKDNEDSEEEEETEFNSSFPLLWLRRLRAWHALPPLMQALLPFMATLDKGQPSDFFRIPYYDDRALPAYNFASLGQARGFTYGAKRGHGCFDSRLNALPAAAGARRPRAPVFAFIKIVAVPLSFHLTVLPALAIPGKVVARALLRHAEKLRRRDPATNERWQRFWGATGAITHGATYCLVNSRKQNDTPRLETANGTATPNGSFRAHGLALKLSYLAFLMSRGASTAVTTKLGQRLPGIRLSREQLFLVMHCALSCTAGGGPGSAFRQAAARQKCVVDYSTTLERFADGPCTNASRVDSLDKCSYV
ncbi:uncharacterized protein LOC142792738 [Rhipicephalus microplus]|uniref:uncharacterized protein LOC142792738 n=1 Tax=Rhipicephalus microplus TaxID=6941 RepID=UPI003F6C8DE1